MNQDGLTAKSDHAAETIRPRRDRTVSSESGERYSRQVLFPGIGKEGQQNLSSSRVAVVGCGAIGCSMSVLLARAGVGELTIIDRDYVEPSNLQRQILFTENDALESHPKALAAASRIDEFNTSIAVQAKVADLRAENMEELLGNAGLILDATDNFETRYLINDYAVLHGIPWIYAAAVAAYCATMTIVPGRTACLACIFPEPPVGTVETCDTAGILNTAVNLVASIAVTEAMKILVGATAALRSTLLSVDLWSNRRSEISSGTPRPDCRACGQRKFLHLAGVGRPHITLCGRNSVQIHEHARPVSFLEMSRRLAPHGRVKFNDTILKFWHGSYEITLFGDGRAIIKGTTDTAMARSLYSRFIGS